ncbi:MAG TPA: TonB-dependent receptor [Gemmatimonadales bacterium]|nr:TonB-dependent receptor [Gemmatimonadales bacterium]
MRPISHVLRLSVMLTVPAAIHAQGPSMSFNAYAMRFTPTPVSDVETLPLLLRQPLSLRLDHVTVERALREITRRAAIDLSYSRSVVPVDRVVSVDVADQPVAEALRQVLQDTRVELWVATSGKMALVPIMDGTGAGGSISGRVTESRTGRPVAAARVALAGTRWWAATDDSGRYRIADVPAGRYTLSVRRIAYVEHTEVVVIGADQDITVNVTLELSVTPLDAVVVTGTIVATEQKELPNPISIVTGKELVDRGVTQINQLFRGEIPGVFTADFGDASHLVGAPVYVRGTTELFDLPTLKTYIDGVEIANSEFINEIDPAMIDHIEIIRGPQASTLYGAQAINGVMQIFTKKGALATPPHVTATIGAGALESPYATGDREEANIQASGGINELSYNVGTSFQHDGAWTRDYRRTAFSGFGGMSIQPKGSPLRVDLTARIGQQSVQTSGSVGLPQAMATGQLQLNQGDMVPHPSKATLPQQTLGIVASYTPASGWRHSLTLGYDRGADGNNQITQPAYVTPSDSFLFVYSTQTTRLTAAYHASVDTRLSDRVSTNFIVGADYWRYLYNGYTDYVANSDQGGLNTKGDTTGATVTIDRTHDYSTGVFTQARLGIDDALFVTAGVRADQSPSLPDDKHHRSINPRVGASYALDLKGVQAKLRAGYGSALKPADPGLKRGATFSSNYVQLPAPDLKPEEQTGWDAGVELYDRDRASLSVTRYDQTARNLIAVAFLAFDPVFVQQFQNVARVRNKGWELEGSLRLVKGLSMRATYSYVDSRVDSLGPNDQTGYTVGQSLLGVPHHTGALTLSERTSRVLLEAGVDYVGSSSNYDPVAAYHAANPRLGAPNYNSGLVTLPEAYRYTARAAFDLTPTLTLWGRVDNLTNVIVRDQGYFPVDQIGRQTVLGIRVR